MDVLVVAGSTKVPDYLLARSGRVVELAGMEVSVAVLADLRARIRGASRWSAPSRLRSRRPFTAQDCR